MALLDQHWGGIGNNADDENDDEQFNRKQVKTKVYK